VNKRSIVSKLSENNLYFMIIKKNKERKKEKVSEGKLIEYRKK
jgi:hypothetical protein